MAIEDAFVLATLLREYWDQPDGHVEAFYQYEVYLVFRYGAGGEHEKQSFGGGEGGGWFAFVVYYVRHLTRKR